MIEADVCVVGSGAGGGVIAGELTAAGKSVCVLEMGGYHDDRDFDQLELSAYQRLYLNGGPFPTAEGQVGVVAGTGVGGGTVVNWTNCLRTHDWVRAEWAREHGLEGLDRPEFDAHLDAVWERLGVNADCSDLSGPHLRLQEACEKLGYDFRPITRNADRELYDPASRRLHGLRRPVGLEALDREDLSASTPSAPGATIVSDCRVERILVEDGRAAGVEAVYIDPEAAGNGGGRPRVVVRAPVVVVACGSIESPALLLRSGIGGPAVGDYLRLHPTAAVTAYYDEPQNWCWGPPQAALSHEFADVGDGHGYLIESAQATTGLFAGAVPWRSGADHKRLMRSWDHAAPLISLLRERGHGRVVIDADGNAVTNYPVVNELDIRDIRAGVEQLVRMHEAAGATEIVGSARKAPRLEAAATTSRRSSPSSTRSRSAARVPALLRAPDGHLPDGRRPADLGRRPARRAARHAGRLGRRRERLPERLGDEPDADDHGAGAAHRARDRRVLALGVRRQAHRRGHRADRRRRPRGGAGARGAPGGRPDHRHGAAPVRPRRARLGADRVPPGRHPRPRLGRRPGRRRRRCRPPRVHHLRRPRGGPPGQPQGLAQRVRGGAARRREAARLHVVGRRLRL